MTSLESRLLLSRLFVFKLLFVREYKNQITAAHEIKTISRFFFKEAGVFGLLQFRSQIDRSIFK